MNTICFRRTRLLSGLPAKSTLWKRGKKEFSQRYPSGWADPSGLVLTLQLTLVLFEERLQGFDTAEQPFPLLVVERNRKATQAIDTHSSLRTDFEGEVASCWFLLA